MLPKPGLACYPAAPNLPGRNVTPLKHVESLAGGHTYLFSNRLCAPEESEAIRLLGGPGPGPSASRLSAKFLVHALHPIRSPGAVRLRNARPLGIAERRLMVQMMEVLLPIDPHGYQACGEAVRTALPI
jgi:hypothetical protein